MDFVPEESIKNMQKELTYSTKYGTIISERR